MSRAIFLASHKENPLIQAGGECEAESLGNGHPQGEDKLKTEERAKTILILEAQEVVCVAGTAQWGRMRSFILLVYQGLLLGTLQ